MAYGDYIAHCVDCGHDFLSGKKWAKRCRVCKKERYKLHPREKFIILKRDDFKCIYCGLSSIENQEQLHVDHVIPKSSGGESRACNLVTCCSNCNSSKFSSMFDKPVLGRILEEIQRRNAARGIDGNQIILYQNQYYLRKGTEE